MNRRSDREIEYKQIDNRNGKRYIYKQQKYGEIHYDEHQYRQMLCVFNATMWCISYENEQRI